MPLLQGGCFSACLQSFLGILVDRLQQGETRLPAQALLWLHQALVQQLGQLVQDRALFSLWQGRGRGCIQDADDLHRLQREATDEDRQAPEQCLFTRIKQVVAPGNRVA
jgi:hypothetical protein